VVVVDVVVVVVVVVVGVVNVVVGDIESRVCFCKRAKLLALRGLTLPVVDVVVPTPIVETKEGDDDEVCINVLAFF
jgi:hypothetical protein